eukprot:CAMPEP_0119120956 /NCGR_PEP_ID=MMETSP1310-20130426/1784_1 /TAXON_ID=464262 /ORGANISM="Genus nov. species nov., Strain RCC2339" /LENGTH=357 /DNA_ID=CAMNT_0007110479 /DNA_START=71 /DNA_END=1144 /DNA_ORIENTATION=+
MSPSLMITKQESLATQEVARDGVHRKVCVNVKNMPFALDLSVVNNFPQTSSKFINFRRCSVEASVCYDARDPAEGKKVELVSSKKPVTYKFQVSDKNVDEGSLEVRMLVLTSQHEDSLFRLHVRVLDSHQELVLSTISEAIKVVSKPDQVRRIRGEKVQSSGKGKKRTHSDMVGDTLSRIEEAQRRQEQLLLRLLGGRDVGDGADDTMEEDTDCGEESGPPPAPAVTEPPRQAGATDGELSLVPLPSFDKTLALALKQFAAIPSDERPNKIRRVLQSSTMDAVRSMTELCDIVTAETSRGLQATASTASARSARGTNASSPIGDPMVTGDEVTGSSFGYSDFYQDLLLNSYALPEYL